MFILLLIYMFEADFYLINALNTVDKCKFIADNVETKLKSEVLWCKLLTIQEEWQLMLSWISASASFTNWTLNTFINSFRLIKNKLLNS